MMNNPLKPLVDIFNLNTKLFLNSTEGMDDANSRRCFSSGSNNILFIAIHMLDARYYLARLTNLDLQNPYKFIFDSILSVNDLEDEPTLDEIRNNWTKISPKIKSHLNNIDQSILIQPAEWKFPIADQTKQGALSFLLSHEAYHIGQMAFLHKLILNEPMSYD